MRKKGYRTIKELVFDIIRQTDGKVGYETVTKTVKKYFPKSKWKEPHWRYYRSAITSKNGRYKNAFGKNVKRNLSEKVGMDHRSNLSKSKLKKKKQKTKKEKIKHIGDTILHHVRFVINTAAGNDADMRFKLKRWVYARLMQDERREKRFVKKALWDSGIKSCQKCFKEFRSIKGVEIHRKDSEKIYSVKNCELLCRSCHLKKT